MTPQRISQKSKRAWEQALREERLFLEEKARIQRAEEEERRRVAANRKAEEQRQKEKERQGSYGPWKAHIYYKFGGGSHGYSGVSEHMVFAHSEKEAIEIASKRVNSSYERRPSQDYARRQ